MGRSRVVAPLQVVYIHKDQIWEEEEEEEEEEKDEGVTDMTAGLGWVGDRYLPRNGLSPSIPSERRRAENPSRSPPRKRKALPSFLLFLKSFIHCFRVS